MYGTGVASIPRRASVVGKNAISRFCVGVDGAWRRDCTRSSCPPSRASNNAREPAATRSGATPTSILGAIGIFVYVGAEVSIGSFLVNYFSQPDIGNISEQTASGLLSFYWGGAMVGRFIGSALQQKIAANKILGVAALVAALLVIASMLTFGHVAMWTIIAVGLFNSVMFPTIFTLAIEGLGPLTGDGSGLLVAAIVGGAIIPELQGLLADRIGIHHAFFLPILCYLYIAYYAFVGSQQKDSRANGRA